MIKCIIQCADIHIRNFKRHEEYTEQLEKFITKCYDFSKQYDNPQEEMRILICGDIVHQKTDISNELFILTSNFIRELSNIAPVLIYAGNHDLLVNNNSKIDTLTALFETAHFTNVTYLDSQLNYQSGCLYDDNIIWSLYSIHDNYSKPNIEPTENKTVIGLYHGIIVGAQLNNGFTCDNGLDGDVFEKCDIAMLGDIHKHQEFYRGDCLCAYSGSLIQQTYGETVTQHGFIVWDIENNTHEFIELETNYGLYDFEIDNIMDIENDKERLINF